jgi:UDP-N-acetylmuramate dehydrogenase
MIERHSVPLSELTTLRVGGPARRLIEASSEGEIVEAVRAADVEKQPLLVMGRGSNLLVSDEGFAGTVLRLTGGGMARRTTDGTARVTVAAGEVWDDFVSGCVAERLAGVECLSGIPGLVGATPIQNVGAYGQEVAQTIVAVRAYDRAAGNVVDLAPAQCEFGYRTSAFRRSSRHVVLAVTFALEPAADARPIRYQELARRLGLRTGERPPLAEVREAVLTLRRAKGMVLDPDDPDSVSAGSFFLNALLAPEQAAELQERVRSRLGEGVAVPAWPEEDGRVKVSAAWLIEQAGFSRGFGSGRVGISSKHTLAVINRGGASAGEIAALARQMRDGVREAFGVTLAPEPTLVGIEL